MQRSSEVNVDNSSNLVVVKKRNWHFELLRIISMFLIVATHYFAEDDWAVRIDPTLSRSWGAAIHETTGVVGQVGVVLFVLISAYFSVGRDFRVSTRLKKLWVQVFFYSVVCMAAYALLGRTGVVRGSFIHVLELREIISSFLPITFIAYWFVSAFFVMTLLAPYLNRFIGALSEKELLAFTGVCLYITFGWKYLNPQAGYFTDVLYFLSIYLIAACCKTFSNKLPHITWWMVILITVVSLAICCAGTHAIRQKGYYVEQMGYKSNLFTAGPGASPLFAVIIGTVIFLYTMQLENSRDSLMGNFILASAPATFGVYLLHENFLLKPVLWHYVFLIPSGSGALKLGVAAVTIVVLFCVLMLISYVIQKLIMVPLLKRIH